MKDRNRFIGVNLVPAARRIAKARRTRARLWITAAALYGSAVMLVIVITRMVWVFDNHTLSSRLAGLNAEIENSDNAAKLLRVELKQARDLWDTRNVVADQADWSILLAAISQQVGDDVVLRSCQLKKVNPLENVSNAATQTTPPATAPKATSLSDQFALTIAGLGQSQSAVSQFVLRLEQFDLFKQVRLVETRREPFLTDDAVAFRIACMIE